MYQIESEVKLKVNFNFIWIDYYKFFIKNFVFNNINFFLF